MPVDALPDSDAQREAPAEVDQPSIQPEWVTIIEPPRGWQLLNAAELWQYRELLYFLIWREVKVRYKQTLLGAAWAVLQPVMMMIVFTIFFGRLAGVSSGDLPYPLFVYAGLLPWTFFATAIANAGNSVVGSERMVTKIYFPRLAIPFAAVGAAVVDYLIAFAMLLVLMLFYRVPPTPAMLLVPVLLAVTMLAALGVGSLLAALNVAYRDFRYVIPFLVQLWMFATPSVYMQLPAADEPVAAHASAAPAADQAPSGGAENLPPRATGAAPAATSGAGRDEPHTARLSGAARWAIEVNPLTGLIASFRSATLGQPVPWRSLAISSLGAVAMFVVGCLYFRRVEDSFADII